VTRRPTVLALTLLLTACSTDAAATPPGPRPTVPPVTTTTLALSVVDRVEEAYRRAWAVYAAAVGRTDPSGLPRAFAGPALVLKRREVAALARADEAIRVRVEHHLEVVLVDERTAVVTDRIENHMIRIDARTRRTLEADPDDVLTRAYTLREEGGQWLVTEAVALG
jgi:hypothetical protein